MLTINACDIQALAVLQLIQKQPHSNEFLDRRFEGTCRQFHYTLEVPQYKTLQRIMGPQLPVILMATSNHLRYAISKPSVH